MSTETPFEPFDMAEQAGAAPAVEPEKPTRKKRERKVVAVNEQPAELTRKKRSEAKVRMPRGLKLPVDVMLTAMNKLKATDADLVTKLIGILNGAGKGQRQRVLGAINKIFG